MNRKTTAATAEERGNLFIVGGSTYKARRLARGKNSERWFPIGPFGVEFNLSDLRNGTIPNDLSRSIIAYEVE